MTATNWAKDAFAVQSVRKNRLDRPTVSSIRGRLRVGPDSPLVQFESAVERDFLKLCASENQVVQVISQPFTIKFRDTFSGKNGIYTPDFLVKFDSENKRTWGPSFQEQILVEVKPYQRLVKNRKKLIPKIHAARQWCAENDTGFHVITDRWLAGAKTINAELLCSSLQLDTNSRCETAIKNCLDGSLGCSIGNLIDLLSNDGFEKRTILQTLYQCIAKAEIDTDLYSPLTLDHLLDYKYGRFPAI